MHREWHTRHNITQAQHIGQPELDFRSPFAGRLGTDGRPTTAMAKSSPLLVRTTSSRPIAGAWANGIPALD